MMNNKDDKILVCCRDCKFLENEYIHELNPNHIDGDNEDDPHIIETPSGTCQTKIQMCQHKECFIEHGFAIGGMPCWRYFRTQGQAQLNPYGKCEHYKRKWWKFWKPQKAT